MWADMFQSVIADYETGERRIRLEMQFKLMWAHRLETAAACTTAGSPALICPQRNAAPGFAAA
jgi:hypothetical protein